MMVLSCPLLASPRVFAHKRPPSSTGVCSDTSYELQLSMVSLFEFLNLNRENLPMVKTLYCRVSSLLRSNEFNLMHCIVVS
jgi:hypothetical protein